MASGALTDSARPIAGKWGSHRNCKALAETHLNNKISVCLNTSTIFSLR